MLLSSLGHSSEAFLEQVLKSPHENMGKEKAEEGEREVEVESDLCGGKQLQYYLKVMSIFEKVPYALGVVTIGEIAVREADEGDPLCVSNNSRA